MKTLLKSFRFLLFTILLILLGGVIFVYTKLFGFPSFAFSSYELSKEEVMNSPHLLYFPITTNLAENLQSCKPSQAYYSNPLGTEIWRGTFGYKYYFKISNPNNGHCNINIITKQFGKEIYVDVYELPVELVEYIGDIYYALNTNKENAKIMLADFLQCSLDTEEKETSSDDIIPQGIIWLDYYVKDWNFANGAMTEKKYQRLKQSSDINIIKECDAFKKEIDNLILATPNYSHLNYCEKYALMEKSFPEDTRVAFFKTGFGHIVKAFGSYRCNVKTDNYKVINSFYERLADNDNQPLCWKKFYGKASFGEKVLDGDVRIIGCDKPRDREKYTKYLKL